MAATSWKKGRSNSSRVDRTKVVEVTNKALRRKDPETFGRPLALIVTFMLGEVVVGVLSGSLALLSDAAHMLTDAVALAMSLAAARLAAKPATGSKRSR